MNRDQFLVSTFKAARPYDPSGKVFVALQDNMICGLFLGATLAGH